MSGSELCVRIGRLLGRRHVDSTWRLGTKPLRHTALFNGKAGTSIKVVRHARGGLVVYTSVTNLWPRAVAGPRWSSSATVLNRWQ